VTRVARALRMAGSRLATADLLGAT